MGPQGRQGPPGLIVSWTCPPAAQRDAAHGGERGGASLRCREWGHRHGPPQLTPLSLPPRAPLAARGSRVPLGSPEW